MCKLIGMMVCLHCMAGIPLAEVEDHGASAPVPEIVNELNELANNKECGMHALYLMLRLRNYDISHEEFRAAVPVGNDGSSLADLQDAARRLGVETGVYHCELPELMNLCKRPVVVLIHNHGAGLIDHALATSSIEVGHYVTILGRDETTGLIIGIDGSEGRVRKFSEMRFLQMWTGYVLLPRDITWWSQWKWIIAVNVACWIMLILWFGGSIRPGHTSKVVSVNGSLPVESAVV